MSQKDAKLIENIRQVLDQSVEKLDSVTASRLTQARSQALESRQKKRFPLLYWGSLPAAGLLLLVLLFSWPGTTIPPVAVPEINELSILTSADPLDFYQEDIEFYEWLSEVIEAEKKLSDHSRAVPAVIAGRFNGSGAQRAGIAEYRIARISGVI
ncbi:MAG: hypothetical protein BA864_12145 [Desulfuromonadales bacterium C00003093]|nr:MAG: hypothetical protein BA864_12145 [Desulfuromonadales bacterium C00003093]